MLMDNGSIEQPVANIRKLQTARYLAGQQVVYNVLGVSSSLPALNTGNSPSSLLEQQVAALVSAFNQLNLKMLEQEDK